MKYSLKLIKATESRTSLSSIQSLRYAICCTLATCIAALIQHYWGLPAQSSLFFTLTAAIAVFFSYGETWKAQSIAILFGALLVAIFSFISTLLQPHFIALLLFLGAVSFSAYYFSTINTGTLFICKLGILLLCFTFDDAFKNDIHAAWQVCRSILAGGVIAAATNLFLYTITPKLNVKNIDRLWRRELLHLLKQLQKYQKKISTQNFSEINTIFKNKLTTNHAEFAFTTDRAGKAIIKLSTNLNQHPKIHQLLGPELLPIFQSAEKSIVAQQPKFLLNAYQDFRNKIFLLREQHFFSQMQDNLRSQYAELLFLMHKFVEDISQWIQQALHMAANAQCIKNNAGGEIFNILKQNNQDNIKIGLRAAFTIVIALVFAHFSHAEHVPWIVLSANLVLLARQGDTIKRSLDRIMGHVVGFAFAIPLGFYLWPHWDTPFFWLPLLVFLTSYYYLKNYFLYSALLMLIILYIYFLTTPLQTDTATILAYISWRLYDITVGCILATIACVAIFPKIGAKPVIKSVAQILQHVREHLQLLETNWNTPEKISAGLQDQEYLLQQLFHAQQALRALQFEPKRFRHNFSKTKKILANTETLLELLTALSRRLYVAHTYFENQPQLAAAIRTSLTYLENKVLQTAQHVTEEHRHTCLHATRTQHSKSYDFTQQKSTIFEYADRNFISYDELINTLGVLILLENIDSQLTKLIAA